MSAEHLLEEKHEDHQQSLILVYSDLLFLQLDSLDLPQQVLVLHSELVFVVLPLLLLDLQLVSLYPFLVQLALEVLSPFFAEIVVAVGLFVLLVLGQFQTIC